MKRKQSQFKKNLFISKNIFNCNFDSNTPAIPVKIIKKGTSIDYEEIKIYQIISSENIQ